LLDRAGIARLIPHQGRMCLLDRVEAWDAGSIRCRSSAHRDPANPLRRDGRLAAVCMVEPGLQAMALHGALVAGGPQAQGFVTSLREVEIAMRFVDHLPDDFLAVEATLLAAERQGFVYTFAVRATAGPVCTGQAVIIVPAA
jgi:predicted hotdog family 3-hydroxylacyl-ACP dehydratase